MEEFGVVVGCLVVIIGGQIVYDLIEDFLYMRRKRKRYKEDRYGWRQWGKNGL